MSQDCQKKPWTFESFLAQHGDDDRYELIDGQLFDLEPTGPHEEVAAFVARKINVQIDILDLPFFIPQRCLIKPQSDLTGFRPDLVVLDRTELVNELRWHREPVITSGRSIQFVVEVVRSNWQNDYARKIEDYAALGIAEYWIVDYAALVGIRFIGKPKQPTLTICKLVDDRYEEVQLRGSEQITSPIFPGLNLTAEQVLQSATVI
ncbi:Uma2 family endonuclease [filamentous cyanobacterium LEGE 11480]|uniref:Uma2 family endonuclease n=1 Tax=Romeriopsis navalis LEGE 11480 TaxID=2777977 RepID=A0A928Z399_9CYAN|nr:Uma2 family endonuclease [Romeriopsis navalis]MBE9029105.1 Uma2 family endonuclease [Romeriopsis navalis LEGE 11480]